MIEKWSKKKVKNNKNNEQNNGQKTEQKTIEQTNDEIAANKWDISTLNIILWSYDLDRRCDAEEADPPVPQASLPCWHSSSLPSVFIGFSLLFP